MAALPAYANDERFVKALALLERVERRDVYRVVFETLYRDHAATTRQQRINRDLVMRMVVNDTRI
jgi:hypothetical protein